MEPVELELDVLMSPLGTRGQRVKRIIAATVIAGLLSGCTKVDIVATPESRTGTPTQGATGGPVRRHAWTVPHVLRIGDIGEVTTLNPHLYSAASLSYLSEMTMAYLTRYDQHNELIPELATQIPSKQNGLVSGDGLTITWHLRKGVNWSDGVPFDGDDVVYSTNVINNPINNELSREHWDLVAKVDEPDKYTVIYHLKKPDSAVTQLFSTGLGPCILPKHLLSKYVTINHVDYNGKPVGIGPFRYVKWVRGDHIDVEANPYYWRGRPKLQKVIYKFIPDYNTLMTQLQTGEIDMWALVNWGFYPRVKALPNVTTTLTPGYLYVHLDFNEAPPALHR